MDRLRRWLVFYLKYGVPGLLLVFPLALLYGSLNPWPVADRLLGRYVGQTPVMTGAVTEYSSTQDEAQKDWTRIVHRSRSYLLFPMAFRRPMAVTVDQINNDEPTLRESDDTSWPLVSFGLTYAFGFVCVWWFWIRPRLQR